MKSSKLSPAGISGFGRNEVGGEENALSAILELEEASNHDINDDDLKTELYQLQGVDSTGQLSEKSLLQLQNGL